MILRQQKTLSNNHYDFNWEKCRNSIFQNKVIRKRGKSWQRVSSEVKKAIP